MKLHPDTFEIECTSVWAFPHRGNWATHTSDWRGNWAPEVVRNLILRYSKEGDHLLDCMIGGGTTAIEAKILNRNITCIDINEEALERTKKSLGFTVNNKAWQRIKKCDAIDMEFIKDKRLNFIISTAIGLIILVYVLNRLKWLFIYFSIALMLAYFFEPLYKYLINKKAPKILAIIIIMAIIIGLLILTIFFVIPSIINQLNILYSEIPKFIEKYQTIILSLKPQLSKFINPTDVATLIKESLSELQKNALGFSQEIIIYLSNIVSSISFGIVIVPLILFYILRDILIFKENLYTFVSKKKKEEFKEVIEEIDHILSGFIRGRIIICIIVGALIGIGLYVLNLKFALIIGIVSGAFNFIPYLGPIIGVVLALIFALGKPWWILLIILGLFVLVNQIESVFLEPNILGKGLGLHPLTVILAILVCGQLLGILGVLVAVPLAAILKVLMIRYLIQEE